MELRQHWCGLWKGGDGGYGRRKEASLVVEDGWRYEKEARQQRSRLPGHAGVETVVAFVVCMHIVVACVQLKDSLSSLWIWLLCRGFEPAFCSSPHTSPVWDCSSSYLVCLGCSPVPGEQLFLYKVWGFHQIPVLFFSFKTLTRPSSMGIKKWFGSAQKQNLEEEKSGWLLTLQCGALLVLLTSNCFSVTMLWQLVTQSSNSDSLQEAWCIYSSICSATYIVVLPAKIRLMIVMWESTKAGEVLQHWWCLNCRKTDANRQQKELTGGKGRKLVFF